LSNLNVLNLSNNAFEGSIPQSIGSLNKLISLLLHNNNLSGLISDNICNQGDMIPSLFGNQLCPPYPECIEYFIGIQNDDNCY
jgi:hypothetical protein